jgi:hypothetical protein
MFDETGELGPTDYSLARNVIWSVYLGGANFEMHISTSVPSYTLYSSHLGDMTLARTILEELPYPTMQAVNNVLLDPGYVLEDPGRLYAIYLPGGGPANIDLTGIPGTFGFQWIHPHTGYRYGGDVIAGDAIHTLPAPFGGDAVLLLEEGRIFPSVLPTNHSASNGAAPTTALPVAVSMTSADPTISKTGILHPGQSGAQGKLLEWQITVTNGGAGSLTNVLVTDTLADSLHVDRVDCNGCGVQINGQTVSVTIPLLAPGQSVTFSIFTTVVQSVVTVDNTACVYVDASEDCATGSVITVTQLPQTGETPLWQLVTVFGVIVGAVALGTGAVLRHRSS